MKFPSELEFLESFGIEPVEVDASMAVDFHRHLSQLELQFPSNPYPSRPTARVLNAGNQK